MRLITTLLITLSYFTGSIAQQPYFDHFTIESGIANNQVFNITQDDLGYIWFGTLNGLNRYNGIDFDTYMPSGKTNGYLKGNIIIDINKGRDGAIWVVTQNAGLNYYNARDESFYQFPDSLFPFNQNKIHHIIEDTDGNIRFIANNNLYKLNRSNTTISTLTNHKNITQQFAYSNDYTCLINSSRIQLYDHHNEKIINTNTPLSALKEVKHITRDPFFDMHILTSEGIFRYNQEAEQLNQVVDFKELPFHFSNKSALHKLVCDGSNFWIKYDGQLFRLYKNNTKFTIEHIQNNPFNKNAYHGIFTNDIYVDSDRNTWTSTNKNGVNLYNQRKNKFDHYYPYKYSSSNNSINPVRAICETHDGKIWIGFENSGLGYYKPNSNTFFPFDLKTTDIGSLRVIFEDTKKNLWIGTRKGVFILTPNSVKLVSLKEFSGINWSSATYTIKEDENGKIWIGGIELGILDLSNKTINTLKIPQLKSPVRDLQFDGDNIWIATDGNGVLQLAQATMLLTQQFSLDKELSAICDNKVYTVCVQKNNVWAGTNSGLSQINKTTGEINNYSITDGLSSNVIYGILNDDNDNLWISTAKGLNTYNKNNKTFVSYLPNRFFLDDAVHHNANKKIFFGGFSGFIAFNPEQITPAITGQKPVLKDMFIFGKKVPIGNTSVLQQSLSHTKKIILNHTQNAFTFTLNSFPISSSGLCSYKYKLEGYDTNWVNLKQGHSIDFAKVAPGNYTLRVLNSNPDGFWSTNELNLQISITPPFWKTTWFTAILIALATLLIVVLIKARERNIRQRNLLLQREVDIKTQELTQQNQEISLQKDKIEKMSEQVHLADLAKLRFFTNISHEFKTPLTLIIGHLEMIKQANTNKSPSSLQTVKRNAVKLLSLVNDIVDFRKASQSELKLTVTEVNCIKILRDIVDDFYPSAKLKKINLLFEPIKDVLLLWLDQDKFEKIITNLISNAIKYTPKMGTISILVDDYPNSVNIYIKDTGIGIEAEDRDSIFNRFYRSSSSYDQLGHGIGLALAKAFVELHHGSINVESTIGQGSCFSVIFAKGTAHLPQNCFIGHAHAHRVGIIETEVPYTIKTNPLGLIKTGVPSLLIVEDNTELLHFMCELLSPSYSIETTSNGLEAIEKLEKSPVDIIISDIMMPQMDGITLCKTLKKDIRFSHIPLILLTAKNDIETRLEGIKLGIDDYIEKPFYPQLLISRIDALLANRELLKKEFQKGTLTIKDDNSLVTSDKAFIEKACTFMNNNYHNDELSVDDFGKEIAMSRATFFRKFKALTGQAPKDFIKSFRIQKASAFIRAGNNSISEICTMVGYRSPSQFRKAFKEEFNLSPSEYMKTFKHSPNKTQVD